MTTKTIAKETPAVNVDEKAITTKAAALSTEITALTVKDQATYTIAGQTRAKVQEYIKWLDTFYGPSKTALNAAVKKIRDEEKRVIGPRLTFAENLLSGLNRKMSDFLIAEEQRVKKEAREKQERKEKEAAAERAKIQKKADKAEEKGKDAVAEQLREQAAAVTVAPIEVKQAVSFAGTGTMAKDDISVEIVDDRLFLRYLLDSGADIPSLIEFKYKAVKDFVKVHVKIMEGEEVQKAPGIKVEKKKVISAR